MVLNLKDRDDSKKDLRILDFDINKIIAYYKKNNTSMAISIGSHDEDFLLWCPYDSEDKFPMIMKKMSKQLPKGSEIVPWDSIDEFLEYYNDYYQSINYVKHNEYNTKIIQGRW